MLGKTEGRRRRGRRDEMVGRHPRCNGHELGQTLGDGEEQRSLMCCSPWGGRVGHDLATEQQQQQLQDKLKNNKTEISIDFTKWKAIQLKQRASQSFSLYTMPTPVQLSLSSVVPIHPLALPICASFLCPERVTLPLLCRRAVSTRAKGTWGKKRGQQQRVSLES